MDREVTVAGFDLANSVCRIHVAAIVLLYELGWVASSSGACAVRCDNIFVRAIRPPSRQLKKDLERHRRATVIRQRCLRRTNRSKFRRGGFVRYRPAPVLGLFEQPARTGTSSAKRNSTWGRTVPPVFPNRMR